MEPECRISLEIFEGPLDLLLHLINRNKLSITDISISLVTNQYLEYLEFMQALDIEVAAEYLVMAATLMQIKSRMLLPVADQSADEEHPVLEIVGSLEELKNIKLLADLLEKRPLLGRDVFLSDPRIQGYASPDYCRTTKDMKENFDVSILDLMDAFKRVLGGRIMPETIEIIRARVDMEIRIEEIERLLKTRKQINFDMLFEPAASRHVLIVSFLAVLELAKRGIIRLVQEAGSGEIILSFRQAA